MADVHDPKTRSKNMRAIHNHGTAIEKKVAEFLREIEIDYREQVSELSGKPNFVIDERKTIIFVHGCFWHQHDCYLFKLPKTRTEFWKKKISQNNNRDLRVINQLEGDGWKVMLIWECALKGRLRLSDGEMRDRIDEGINRVQRSCYIDTNGIFTFC
ncbi:DNA mismatch endonuclease, patch repair protein [Ewingella americana]